MAGITSSSEYYEPDTTGFNPQVRQFWQTSDAPELYRDENGEYISPELPDTTRYLRAEGIPTPARTVAPVSESSVPPGPFPRTEQPDISGVNMEWANRIGMNPTPTAAVQQETGRGDVDWDKVNSDIMKGALKGGAFSSRSMTEGVPTDTSVANKPVPKTLNDMFTEFMPHLMMKVHEVTGVNLNEGPPQINAADIMRRTDNEFFMKFRDQRDYRGNYPPALKSEYDSLLNRNLMIAKLDYESNMKNFDHAKEIYKEGMNMFKQQIAPHLVTPGALMSRPGIGNDQAPSTPHVTQWGATTSDNKIVAPPITEQKAGDQTIQRNPETGKVESIIQGRDQKHTAGEIKESVGIIDDQFKSEALSSLADMKTAYINAKALGKEKELKPIVQHYGSIMENENIPALSASRGLSAFLSMKGIDLEPLLSRNSISERRRLIGLRYPDLLRRDQPQYQQNPGVGGGTGTAIPAKQTPVRIATDAQGNQVQYELQPDGKLGKPKRKFNWNTNKWEPISQ